MGHSPGHTSTATCSIRVSVASPWKVLNFGSITTLHQFISNTTYDHTLPYTLLSPIILSPQSEAWGQGLYVTGPPFQSVFPTTEQKPNEFKESVKASRNKSSKSRGNSTAHGCSAKWFISSKIPKSRFEKIKTSFLHFRKEFNKNLLKSKEKKFPSNKVFISSKRIRNYRKRWTETKNVSGENCLLSNSIMSMIL